MTIIELRDALDGLHAYDTGCTDSGIKDEELRQRCKDMLATMTGAERAELPADIYGEEPYEWEDQAEFAAWLIERMLP